MSVTLCARSMHVDHVTHSVTSLSDARGAQVDLIPFRDSVLKLNTEMVSKDSVEKEKDDEFEHQMDEDDFSDHDSHYSEDLSEDFLQMHYKQTTKSQPDVTERLLKFSEMINADIKKFFGRKKGDEDSCDIYEDKWLPTKSGRELYYADLLRIAQGDGDIIKGGKKSVSPVSPHEELDNRNTFSGRWDKTLGLGPLGDLFEYGLRHFLLDKKTNDKRLKQLKTDCKKHDGIVPMHNRVFPESFWVEPKTEQMDRRTDRTASGILHSSKPPDFSDLLKSWTGGEQATYNSELSSNDSGIPSPGAVIQAL